MKNHFYIAYTGNKRTEVENIYNYINFDGIDTIIEPFCGSCAMSYYIYTKKPNLKFILNDNNKYLKDMFEILKDESKANEFYNKINSLIKVITKDNNKDIQKQEYNKIIKEDTLYGWFIAHKIYNIRHGLFPFDKVIKEINLSQCPIINFFRNADIIFLNIDGIECFEKYKNLSNNLILLDPPYLASCNDFYLASKVNIYEYLLYNPINKDKAKIYLILEKMWIIQLLFKDMNSFEYNKNYTGATKKKVIHSIYTNQ